MVGATQSGRERRERRPKPKPKWWESPSGQHEGMPVADRRKQIQSAWENYQQWRRDITMSRERSLSSTQARLAMRGLDPDSGLWQEHLDDIEGQYEKDLEEINTGATMEMMQDFWAGEEAKAYHSGVFAEAKKQALEEIEYPTGSTPPSHRTKANHDQTYGPSRRDIARYEGSVGTRIDEIIKERRGDTEAMFDYYRAEFGKLGEEEVDEDMVAATTAMAAGGGNADPSRLAAEQKKKSKNPWL